MAPEDILERLTAASALHRQRRFDEAIAIYRSVLEAEPGQFDAQSFLASALRSSGRLDEAIDLFEEMAASNPARPDFWFNRANALNDAGRNDEAIESYHRSLAITPDNASVLANLAITEVRLGRVEAAIGHYRMALELEANHKIAAHNIGNILSEQGQSHEAAIYLRRTVRNWPELPEGHYNLGLLLLRLGDFANGFREYEWRWDTADFFARPAYRGIPVWQGEPLAGKKLLVHGEQGLGDTIQFAKLLGMARSLGGEVVFHVPEKLERLLKTLPFDILVTGKHSASDADYQIPLMSLPHRLQLTLGSVPALPSFLSAEAELAGRWSEKLGFDRARRVIGFVWQGNPNSPAERGRSLSSPEDLAPFAGLPDIRLMALQKLPVEALEMADTPSGWRVAGLSFTLEHPGPDMDEGEGAFIDTAAILAGIDLFVSVCTAPLHLAGALGRPTVALLRKVPDWRWMMERQDTPWYPRMGLVRQKPDEAGYGPAIGRAVDLVRGLVTSP